MPKQELTEQEWSHFYDVEDLESKPENLTIEASEEELQDVARRLKVIKLNDVKAELTLNREQGGRVIHVVGNFSATVTQECVVTGDSVEAQLSDVVEGWFADKESTVSFAAIKREKEATQSHGEIEILAEEDDPEPVIEGVIDLGELVTQHISLALPEYPHKEGVSHDYADENVQIDEKSPLRKNPFEALKNWKENR